MSGRTPDGKKKKTVDLISFSFMETEKSAPTRSGVMKKYFKKQIQVVSDIWSSEPDQPTGADQSEQTSVSKENFKLPS